MWEVYKFYIAMAEPNIGWVTNFALLGEWMKIVNMIKKMINETLRGNVISIVLSWIG